MIFYIEKNIVVHPKTQRILQKFPDSRVIEIDKYTEVFNRKNQNFKAQKKQGKTFILAEKKDGFIQRNPEYCVSHIQKSYYFSTSLNCPFNCEYCFLQGMYRSAFPLIFINTDDFKKSIEEKIGKYPNEDLMFFSGYDNDSLAMDDITEFTKDFIPWFKKYPNAYLELRTKSANIKNLLGLDPVENVFISWTLSPSEIQKSYEKKTASLNERISALKKLQAKGWKIGIRIEPIIAVDNWEKIYTEFFEFLKKEIDFEKIENIYFGLFKTPKDFLKKMKKMYPQSKIFHNYYVRGKDDQMTYPESKEKEMKEFVLKKCLECVEEEKVFYV